MENLSLEQLLESGAAKIAAMRAERKAAEEKAAEETKARRAEEWDAFWAGVNYVIPPVLLPYVKLVNRYTDRPDSSPEEVDSYQWCWLEVPGCVPVRFVMDKTAKMGYVLGSRARRFWDIPEIGLDDGDGDEWKPVYEWGHSYETDDLDVALATAKERYAKFEALQAEANQRNEGRKAKRAMDEEVIDVQVQEPEPAQPEPTTAEKLVELIRAIAREEVMNYNEY